MPDKTMIVSSGKDITDLELPGTGRYGFDIDEVSGLPFTVDDLGNVQFSITSTPAIQAIVGAMGEDSAKLDFSYNGGTQKFTFTILADVVSNTELADMVASTVKGRATGAGTGDPTDLTTTQLTALINLASSTLPGAMSSADKRSLSAMQGRDASFANPRVFRPLDYAAGNTYDPTGSSNSTTTWTAMMAAVVAFNNRFIIEVPPGVHKVDPAIITGLTANSGAIRGPGRGLCVFIPASAGHFITLPNAMTGSDSFTLSGFTIYNTSGTSFSSGSGININGCDNVLIEEVAFIDLWIDVNVNTAAIKVSMQKSVHYSTNAQTNSVGVQIDNGLAGDTYIGPDVVMSCGGTRRLACVRIIESGHYEVTQANLTGSQYGILINPTAGKIVAFGFHTNVLCDSNTLSGMLLDAVTSTSTIKNIKSVNSWYSGTVAGTGLSGMITQGTAGGIINGITFTSDRFLNNQQHGILHQFGTELRFADCDVKGNSAQTANTYDGFQAAANVGNFSVNGGKYGGSDTTPTGNQRYGIRVEAGTGDLINIVPDDVSGNATGPISIGATGANVFVQGCPGLTPGAALGANAAVANTNTAVLGVTVPKNSVRAGTTFRFSGGGFMSNTTAASSSIFRLYMGTVSLTTAVAAGTFVNGAVARTNIAFSFDGMVTIKSIGAGGTALGYVTLTLHNATQPVASAPVIVAVTVNTTVDNLLQLGFISGAATTTYTFVSSVLRVENY